MIHSIHIAEFISPEYFECYCTFCAILFMCLIHLSLRFHNFFLRFRKILKCDFIFNYCVFVNKQNCPQDSLSYTRHPSMLFPRLTLGLIIFQPLLHRRTYQTGRQYCCNTGTESPVLQVHPRKLKF